MYVLERIYRAKLRERLHPLWSVAVWKRRLVPSARWTWLRVPLLRRWVPRKLFTLYPVSCCGISPPLRTPNPTKDETFSYQYVRSPCVPRSFSVQSRSLLCQNYLVQGNRNDSSRIYASWRFPPLQPLQNITAYDQLQLRGSTCNSNFSFSLLCRSLPENTVMNNFHSFLCYRDLNPKNPFRGLFSRNGQSSSLCHRIIFQRTKVSNCNVFW